MTRKPARRAVEALAGNVLSWLISSLWLMLLAGGVHHRVAAVPTISYGTATLVEALLIGAMAAPLSAIDRMVRQIHKKVDA